MCHNLPPYMCIYVHMYVCTRLCDIYNHSWNFFQIRMQINESVLQVLYVCYSPVTQTND